MCFQLSSEISMKVKRQKNFQRAGGVQKALTTVRRLSKKKACQPVLCKQRERRGLQEKQV